MSKDISANSMECCGCSQGDLLTLVHTLKGEFDAIKGDSDVVLRKKEVFKKTWERMNVFYKGNFCIYWRYQPPLWVFPPPI